MMTRFFALVLLGVLCALPASAASEVVIGNKVPSFRLPVLNADASGLKRWGPDDPFTPPVVLGKPVAPVAAPPKLLLLSFFATYCEPCKREIPELARLHQAYKDQGLAVALVSIDAGDEQKATIVSLIDQHKVTFPVVHDRFQVVARRYAADRLPYMIVVDGTAVVTTTHIGYTAETQAGLEAEVRAGLGLPPLAPPAPVAVPQPSKGKVKVKGVKAVKGSS